jgi:hypothetical protein
MKEKSNQTAIDWLVEKHINQCGVLLLKDIEQAKQMEKEQIIEAFDWGSYSHYDDNPIYKTAEHYYNKTFKSEG